MIEGLANVGIVVEDLEATVAFFVELGMELEGQGTVDDEWANRIVGLDQRVDIAMLRTADGNGRLELMSYQRPKAVSAAPNAPMNTLGIRRLLFTVKDIDAVVADLQARGVELMGELVQIGDSWKMCYLRGPEGIIVALTEAIN